MKITNLLVLLIVVVMATLLPSCMRYEDIKFEGVENIKIGKIGMNETTMQMDLRFNNPNNLGATLKTAQGKAWIQDKYVGDFLLNEATQIPAKSKFSVPVKLFVNLKDVLQNSLNLLFSDSLDIKVEGAADVSKGALNKNFPLKYMGKKSTSELLKNLK